MTNINIKKFEQFNSGVSLTKKGVDNIFGDVKKYILENNKSNNEYHNNKHMLDVFNNSMNLFENYKEEYKLTINDKLHLGLAASFHDYNHSGGKLKDNENIELALDALKTYLDNKNMSEHFDNVKEIIYATEFPHKDMDLDILQKIIRDADTMGGIVDGWKSVVEALTKEQKKTLEEFIPIQIGFLQNMKFNTDYCNKLLKDNKDDIIKELEEMI